MSDRWSDATADGCDTKDTKLTKITMPLIFVFFVNFVVLVAAAVGRLTKPQHARCHKFSGTGSSLGVLGALSPSPPSR